MAGARGGLEERALVVALFLTEESYEFGEEVAGEAKAVN